MSQLYPNLTVRTRPLWRRAIGWLGQLCLAWLLLATFASAVCADEVHAMAGYVQGTAILGSDTSEPSGALALVGWTSDPVLTYDLRLEAELQLSRHWQGLAVGFRRYFGDWLFLAGTGVGNLDADLDWQADGFNFLLQAGVGYRWDHWRVDVRWHHVSNARLRQPNDGTNGVLVLLGRTW